MLEPSSYLLHSPNQINTKFGLHDKNFATLANLNDFNQIAHMLGDVHNLITLDLKPELEHLSRAPSDLYIRVPTLGFTDPAFDYDMRPWFAVPIALNGFGAPVHDPWSASAKQVIAVDLMGNHYPIAFNQDHRIDFEAIKQQAQKPLFTMLKEIIFVFSSQQILQGEGLEPLPLALPFQGQVLMMPPQHAHKEYSIEIGFIKEKKLEANRVILVGRYTDSNGLHINNFALDVHHDHGQSRLDVFVDAQTQTDIAVQQFSLSLCLPAQIAPHPLSNGASAFKRVGDELRLTHYFGFSETSLRKLLTALIPKENLEKIFESSDAVGTFNDFSRPGVRDALYEEVVSGVMTTSIPLMALQALFDDAHFLTALKAISMEDWSEADREVFCELYEPIKHMTGHVSYEFADRLDQCLSLDKLYPQLHAFLPVTDEVKLENLEAILVFEPLEPHPQVSMMTFKAEKDHFEVHAEPFRESPRP